MNLKDRARQNRARKDAIAAAAIAVALALAVPRRYPAIDGATLRLANLRLVQVRTALPTVRGQPSHIAHKRPRAVAARLCA